MIQLELQKDFDGVFEIDDENVSAISKFGWHKPGVEHLIQGSETATKSMVGKEKR